MSDPNELQQRLESAAAEKSESSYPRLRRAMLRSWFISLLGVVVIPAAFSKLSTESAEPVERMLTFLQVGSAVANVSISVILLTFHKSKQWSKLATTFSVAIILLLLFPVVTIALEILTAPYGADIFNTIFVQIAISGVLVAVWGKDYWYAREDVLLIQQRERWQNKSS